MAINFLQILYLLSLALFMWGIKLMADPANAKRGGFVAATGLALVLLGSIFLLRDEEGMSIVQYPWLLGVWVTGILLCLIFAFRPKPAGLPIMVSLFYMLAGATAMLMVVYTLNYIIDTGLVFPADEAEGLPGFVFIFSRFGHLEIFMMVVGLIIGMMSFAGSVIALARLHDFIKNWIFKGQKLVNTLLLLIMTGYAIFLIYNIPVIISSYGFTPTTTDGTKAYSGLYDIQKMLLYGTLPLTLICTIMFALPLNGAKLPVVIAVLNAVAGIAMCGAGFIHPNTALIIAGVLLAVTSVLLTVILSKAINSSYKNRPAEPFDNIHEISPQG